jgi:hypothetical protein
MQFFLNNFDIVDELADGAIHSLNAQQAEHSEDHNKH